MIIGFIGAGNVAQAIARCALAQGHKPGFAVTGHTRSGAVPGKPQISWVFAAAAADSTRKT
jgi:pyrroline-5-carboxylate reductase